MNIYLVYECYFMHDGRFKKVLKKIVDSLEKADDIYDNYECSLLDWLEIEERNLE